MSMNELEQKVQNLRELKRMAEELEAEIAATDELHGPSFKITWKEVTSSRLNGKAVKAIAPRAVGAVLQADHHPPLCAGIRKAPCITADQSQMQET